MRMYSFHWSVTPSKSDKFLVDKACRFCVYRLSHLKCLPHAAYPVAAIDMDMAEVRALFEVNFFGPICMVQEFVHLLIASGDGRIVQTGSISGIMPVPFSAAYNTSKAALHSFANTLRVELAPFK